MKQISPPHLLLIIIIESKNLRIFLPNVSTKIVLNTLTHTRTRIHRIAAISPARRNSPKLAAGPENCGKAPAQGRAQEGAYDSGVEWFTALPANRKYRWTRHARAGIGPKAPSRA